MGYAEIACCKNCEIPVETLDPDQFRHTCHRCNNIWFNDDLLFLDWQTASLNAQVIEAFDKSQNVLDVAQLLINEIKESTK